MHVAEDVALVGVLNVFDTEPAPDRVETLPGPGAGAQIRFPEPERSLQK